jgi:hypothetical protein
MCALYSIKYGIPWQGNYGPRPKEQIAREKEGKGAKGQRQEGGQLE